MKRLALPSLAALTLSFACGTQFSDPIRNKQSAVDQGGAGSAGSSGSAPLCTSQVMLFDGATFATANRLVQDDFTIEAWISTGTSQGSGFINGSALVYSDVEEVMVNDFATGFGDGKFLFSTGGPDTQAVATSSVVTDQWVHVAATRSKGTGVMLAYVNGLLEASAVGNENALLDSATINIGGRAGRNFFTGLMSELRLWKLVRSQRDLLASMHHRLAGNEPGLVGYYRLDDGSGAVLADSSESANDAAVTGVAQWTTEELPLCPGP